MKKILVLFLTILIMAMFSIPVFADTFTMGSGNSTATVELSANVEAKYNGASDGSSYAAATYNSKGMGRAYGTASDTTYIYYTSATGASSALGAATNSSAFSGWTQIGKE